MASSRPMTVLALAAATGLLLAVPLPADEMEAPTMATLTLTGKTLLDATSPLMHASYLHPTGLEMTKIGGYSVDNGLTWTSLP